MMTERVPVVERILGANERLAADNRARLDAAGVFSLNFLASPGAVSYTHLDVYKRQQQHYGNSELARNRGRSGDYPAS